MKKIKILICVLIVLLITSCGKSKSVEGYWCNYEEKALLTILLDKNITVQQKKDLEDAINEINDLDTFDFISAQDFALNTDINPDEIYDTYFIYLKNSSALDESLSLMQNMKGVYSANKEVLKNNLVLYHLKDGEFSHQTELFDDTDVTKGKYKVTKNKIEFDKDKIDSIYIKDDYLCLDEGCSKILIETDSNCNPN